MQGDNVRHRSASTHSTDAAVKEEENHTLCLDPIYEWPVVRPRHCRFTSCRRLPSRARQASDDVLSGIALVYCGHNSWLGMIAIALLGTARAQKAALAGLFGAQRHIRDGREGVKLEVLDFGVCGASTSGSPTNQTDAANSTQGRLSGLTLPCSPRRWSP